MLSKIYEEGHQKLLLEIIIYHIKYNTANKKSGGYMTSLTRHKQWKMTTWWWELCVSWGNVANEWIHLKDLRDSYPVQLSLYAKYNNIHDDTAFER